MDIDKHRSRKGNIGVHLWLKKPESGVAGLPVFNIKKSIALFYAILNQVQKSEDILHKIVIARPECVGVRLRLTPTYIKMNIGRIVQYV